MTIIGTMHRIDAAHGAVRMEDVFDTDQDDLWSALTRPDRLSRWMGDVEGDLRVGGTIRARFTSSWEGPGRIEVCDGPNHLVVALGIGTPDETMVEAVLTAEDGRTRLVVEERGLPLDNLPVYGAGWQAHVEDLGRYLAGEHGSRWRARWDELSSTYESAPIG